MGTVIGNVAFGGFRALAERVFGTLRCRPDRARRSSMADERQLPDDLARLAALQAHLRALEDPNADLSAVDPNLTPGVRRRLTARSLDEAIRARRARRGAVGLQQTQRRARRLAHLARTHPIRVRRPTAEPPARREPDGGLPVFWSPTPILGFRVWAVGSRLRGAQRAWTGPTYTAGCLDFGEIDDPDVPHTDGRCVPPPCGLYAAKSISALVSEFGLPGGDSRWAYGMVALSGKVVEHEHGYRARRATAVAVAVVGRGELVRVERERDIAELFASPQRTVAEIGVLHPDRVERIVGMGPMVDRLITYMDGARLVHEAVAHTPNEGND
jgi:hypothetical protein